MCDCVFKLLFLSFSETFLANPTFTFRHAEVMKKIIETVAEGGGELGVHMYPFMEITGYMAASLTYCMQQFWCTVIEPLWTLGRRFTKVLWPVLWH